MGNRFDISFLTSSLTNVRKTDSVNTPALNTDIKVYDTNVSNPISNTPAYTDADLAEMYLLAGVEPTDAPVATSTTKSLAAVEAAGFDLVDLDEIFEDEPDVVAHTLTAFQDGSALRIGRENQSTATLIENLPEGTTPEEFEAFMYAINA